MTPLTPLIAFMLRKFFHTLISNKGLSIILFHFIFFSQIHVDFFFFYYELKREYLI